MAHVSAHQSLNLTRMTINMTNMHSESSMKAPMNSHPGLSLSYTKRLLMIAMLATAAACGSDGPTEPEPAPGFLGGVPGNREIGAVVNSIGNSLTLFQLGSPGTTVQIALGSSTTITPIGFSVRARKAAVPLGNAASLAIVNLETSTIERHFTFSSGNATGSVWVNDSTVFVANTNTDQVGRASLKQTASEITSVTPVAPAPTALAFASGRVLAISGNLENYMPKGDGIVTAINPATMAVVGTVETGGTNPNDAAVGPDGLLYVVNTGDYVAPGSLAIIDPATLTRVAVIQGMGSGPGHISIDANGLAYISSYSDGTIVWNTKTRSFVRAPGNAVCAKLTSTGACRGASSAAASADGRIYQTFFGSPSKGLAPYTFVYDAGTFALRDSIAVGSGPSGIVIRKY